MLQFSYLPYFPSAVKIDLAVGRAHFFNFWEYKDKYIEDTILKDKIEGVLAMYVDSNQRPLRQQTVAVIDGNYAFEPLIESQQIDLQKYALALLFCSIVGDQEYGAWASEHFVLYHQNFLLGEDTIGYDSGSFVRVRELSASISKVRFVKPAFVTDMHFYEIDDRLLRALAAAIDTHSIEAQRIFSALKWVRYACMNADGYSTESRAVMMATAFEVLLDVPENNKATEFADRLEALLAVSEYENFDETGNSLSKGLPIVTEQDKRGKTKSNTMYGWWARDFYWMRSEIVHRGEVGENEMANKDGASPLRVSLMLMRYCIYRSLEKCGFLTYEMSPAWPGFSTDQFLTYRELRRVEEFIRKR